MELTKQQVASIDQHLCENGVKYWDIRIEMLDHIVTDVENRMHSGKTFEVAKGEALAQIGWSGNLSDIAKERLQGINKKVRNGYFREFGKLFVNLKTLLVVIVSVGLLYVLYSRIDYSLSKTISAILYLTPSCIAIAYTFFAFTFKKSAYIQYGAFYMTFSFFMLNFILMVLKHGSWGAEEIYKWTYLAVAVVNALFVYAGIKTYLQAQKMFPVYKNN